MFESALLIVSGVGIYGGVHQLHLSTGKHGVHPHVLHAVMFFLLAGFAMLSSAAASMQSVAQLSLYGKLAVSLGLLLFAMLPWIVVLSASYRHRLLPALLSVAWSMLLLLNLGSTSSLLYREIHLSSQVLPSGQTSLELLTSPNPWWRLVELTMLATLAFSFHVIYRCYRRKEKKLALVLGTGLLVLSCTTFSDFLVHSGMIQSAYLAPMGFLLFLLIASIQTSEAKAPQKSPGDYNTPDKYKLAANPVHSAPEPPDIPDSSWDNGDSEPEKARKHVQITYQQIVPAFSFADIESIKRVTEPATLESTIHLEPTATTPSENPAVETPVEASDATREEPVDYPTVDQISDSLVDIAVHATMIMNRLKDGQAVPEELEELSRKVRTRAIETRRITHRILRSANKPNRK